MTAEATITIVGGGILALVGWTAWLRHRVIIAALEHGYDVGDDDEHAMRGGGQ